VEGHIYPEADGKYSLAANEYGFLRTVFQNLSRFEDEDWAYYQFKRMLRKGKAFSYNPLSLLKRGIEYFFLDLGCGYGTKPFRTLMMSGILLLFFAFFYFLHFDNVNPALYGVPSPIVTRALYAIDLSVTAFSGGYGDLTIQGPIRLVAMIEYLLGVVLVGLFVVAFSRKVIR
jgi:hypothetical protein